MEERPGGDRELREALSESRRLFLSCALFSVFVNLLMLTGPLFMLQVYDRVLSSRSEATLVALAAITAFLFLMMGVLDHARGRVLARAGARLRLRLDGRVTRAVLARSLSPAERSRPAAGLRDLEAIQRFAQGTGPFAFFDAPWTPVFLCVLFLFHWMLGVLAVFSGGLLVALALLNQARTGRLQAELGEANARASHFVEQMRAGSEAVRGLGMQDAVLARSGALRDQLLERGMAASDRTGLFGVTAKTLRLFLQSMMLGLGAWLAIQGLVTFGAIIAASILLGRALAPIDQAVAQWPTLQRVLVAYRSLAALLAAVPPEPMRTALPKPRALLEAQSLTAAAPGARVAAVRGATFRLAPGRAAGIAGRSASGKSTLARVLAGVWRPLGGSVRLDGAELEQYGSDLGRHIGYLPQEVSLFEGTVAENIARLTPDAEDEEIVAAAKRTGAHEMILQLPGGYDFQVSAGGAALSGGQRQRIALARAFFRSPAVVVLDEPDSNLDAEGTMALARAVRGHKKRGGSAVIVAHRHGAFAQCDQVYVMEAGRPVPAKGGAKKAPVRQLQAGAGNQAQGSSAPERTAARCPKEGLRAVASERATDRTASPVRPAGEPSVRERKPAASRRAVRSREEQIARAIAYVTGVPPTAGGERADDQPDRDGAPAKAAVRDEAQ